MTLFLVQCDSLNLSLVCHFINNLLTQRGLWYTLIDNSTDLNTVRGIALGCKGPSVLIVDDAKAICDLIYDGLTEQGYVCDTALSIDEATVKLLRQHFDVVLLDLKLPGISGIEFLRAERQSYRMTAFIMITAVNDLSAAVEAMKLGASDYIVKPFTITKINDSIITVLDSHKPQHTVYNTAPIIGDQDCSNTLGNNSFHAINAIACGVDAQVDLLDSHSKMVTGKTVNLAHCLGLPGKEIARWAIARDEHFSDRDNQIDSMLSKLNQNLMAQVALGRIPPDIPVPRIRQEV